MNLERFSEYRIMWAFVIFDLPVTTQKQVKNATEFRKNLLKDGFNMMQYSFYTRHCVSRENADSHIKHVKAMLPEEGRVCILRLTDKQFEEMEIFYGKKSTESGDRGLQLELF